MSSDDMNVSEIYYQEKVQDYIKNALGLSQWIQVCGHCDLYGADAGFWCGFIPKNKVEASLADFSWDISMSSGVPGFEVNGEGTEYKSQLKDDSEEALLYYREFYGVAPDYVEISQEFILINNLRYDKKHRSYFAMYESGEQEEAVRYKDDCTIEIKAKFLRKYTAAKQLAFILQYDIRTHFSGKLSDYGLSQFGEVIRYKSLCYSINGDEYQISDTVFSRILGKKVFLPEPVEKCGYWPYEIETKYEEFIIGTNDLGNPISYTCNPGLLNNYYGANPGAPMYLTPVFFSREVLQRYYAKPELYTVTDGRLSCQSLWSMELDNHHADVVGAYLGDLGRDLPEVEQHHWKNYNVLTDESLSEVSKKRDFCNLSTESNVIEHQFKRDYNKLNKLWKKVYGWSLYKPLPDEEVYIFDQIRRPLTESQLEFDQLVLLLCKLIIELMNDKELSRNIGDASNLRGIGKLEQWIKDKCITGAEEHIAFLRNLWSLRSSGSGHVKGKSYKKALAKLGLEELPLADAFDVILKAADSYLLYMIDSITPSYLNSNNEGILGCQ